MFKISKKHQSLISYRGNRLICENVTLDRCKSITRKENAIWQVYQLSYPTVQKERWNFDHNRRGKSFSQAWKSKHLRTREIWERKNTGEERLKKHQKNIPVLVQQTLWGYILIPRNEETSGTHSWNAGEWQESP